MQARRSTGIICAKTTRHSVVVIENHPFSKKDRRAHGRYRRNVFFAMPFASQTMNALDKRNKKDAKTIREQRFVQCHGPSLRFCFLLQAFVEARPSILTRNREYVNGTICRVERLETLTVHTRPRNYCSPPPSRASRPPIQSSPRLRIHSRVSSSLTNLESLV